MPLIDFRYAADADMMLFATRAYAYAFTFHATILFAGAHAMLLYLMMAMLLFIDLRCADMLFSCAMIR